MRLFESTLILLDLSFKYLLGRTRAAVFFATEVRPFSVLYTMPDKLCVLVCLEDLDIFGKKKYLDLQLMVHTNINL